MASLLEEKQKEKSDLSEFITDYDKTSSNLNKAKKEFFLNSCNDYSELKQSYLNTPLKNISINFGFPNTMNTYKYKNSFPLSEVPLFEQRNVFYYDKDFQLFKNKSVSKYGEKKNKNNTSTSQISKYNRIFSPQHKIITSIKKKKYLDEIEVENIKNKAKNKIDEKIAKDGKDIYELEVVNQVLLDDEDPESKNKKNGLKELDNEWGEIEQEIFENEKDKKNNLLNSIYVEIEKENGEKQLKVVEITKEEQAKKEPCIKIKYTVEDRICLNGNEYPGEEQYSNYDKETKDSVIKSLYYKTNTNSTSNINYSMNSMKKHEYSTLKKENVSEILLKESKSTQNIFTYSDKDNEKIYFSGSSIPSTKKSKKYSNYKQDYNLPKEKRKIEPIKYTFGKEEEISPIRKVNETEEKNVRLMDIINDEKEEEDVKPNQSIELEEKYFFKKKEISEKEKEVNVKENEENMKTFQKNKFKKNFFEENKEKIEKEEIAKEPKSEKEEEIITEGKEIVEKIPIEDKKEESKGFVRRFKVKDLEKKEKEKEMIIDRNKILKEKKMQELEIEKEKVKKNKKERYYSLDEEPIKDKETEKTQGIRDKYRKKNKRDEKDKNEEVLNINIISKREEKEPLKIEKDVSKSQVIREIYKKEEKERYTYKGRFYKGKNEKEDNEIKDKNVKEEETINKYRVNTNWEQKVKKNITEIRYDTNEDENINVDNKRNLFKRDFSSKDNKNDKENEIKSPIRYRYNTFQNRKNLEESKDKENVEKIIEVRRWGGDQRFKEKKSDEKEEKERIEKERIAKEDKERQERIEKERKERLEKERKERQERERQERERQERERKERERLEKERQERERKERERQERERQERERLEKERQERERKERERQERERQERERKERERKEKEKERERIKKEKERERIEKEKKEKERIEREKREKEEIERKKKLEKEKKEREDRERKERERLEREQIERERKEKERKEMEERIRREKEKKEQMERQRREKEERERKERERKEREKKEREEKERKEKLEREKKEKEKKEKEEKRRKEIIDKENRIKKEKEEAKQKNITEKKIIIKKIKDKKEPIIEKYIKPEVTDNSRNKLKESKSLYDINKYKINNKSKTAINNVNISTIYTSTYKEKSKEIIQPKKEFKEKIIEINYDNKNQKSKTFNVNYNKNKEKRIEIDLTLKTEKPDLKPKITKEPKELSKPKEKPVEREEFKITTTKYDRQPIKDNKEIIQNNDMKEIKVKRNNIKEIEFTKTLNNKGLDQEEKRHRYISTETEKESKKSEIQLFRNKLKNDQQSLQDINKSNAGKEKSEIIVHKTNLFEVKKPLTTAYSTQNINKSQNEIKKEIYTREPEQKPLKAEIIRNIYKDTKEEDKNIKSSFNQYKQGIVKRKVDDEKNIYKNKTYKSPEISEKLGISNNYTKSFKIPSETFSQKTEVKHIKKIYPKEETKTEITKKDNRFISKTLKVDDKRKQRNSYYWIPDAINIRFMETKISNRSQEKVREYDDDQNKKLKSKTSDKGRRRIVKSLNEQEIKELIKEKYMFNEVEEENERKERELDYDRIDREIKNARERIERERQRRKNERLEKERPEKERKEKELREKIEKEENEMKLKRSKERAESERKQREKIEKIKAENERKERERKEKQRAESERKEKEKKERERAESERKAKERAEFERKEKERKERLRAESERKEKEKKERLRAESERKEKERVDRERKEKERRDKERAESERKERERKEKERIEKEKRERIEKERKEKERLEREERERKELERKEKERIEKERKERERIEREKQEKERKERIERERQEKERKEKLRQESIERERQERLEKERKQKERIELEKKEREKQKMKEL